MTQQSLIIRAPNWIGDCIYCLPAWERLSEHFQLHIVGKGWLADLLSGYPEWLTYKLPSGLSKRSALYRNIAQNHSLTHGLNAVVFPTSIGSALELRLAGLKTLGHAHEGRSLLLKKAVPMPVKFSSVYRRYWQLTDILLGQTQAVPTEIHFRIKLQTLESTQAKLKAQGYTLGHYIAVCPFAGGNFEGLDKKWPHFAAWAELCLTQGQQLVCCPAPNEEADWAERYPMIPALKGLTLSEYAVVLQNAQYVVANDTGPGHLAAAVGAPLFSVFNKTIREMYGAIGPQVEVIQTSEGWPSAEHVFQTIQSRT